MDNQPALKNKSTVMKFPLFIAVIVFVWAQFMINRSAKAQAPTPAPAPTVPTADTSTFFPLPPTDSSQLGLGIQRTMRLLATSTPVHRNRVRILFYGQSITEQDWSKQVADDLRSRFPNADLDIRNLAIGGFAAQWLIRPAEHDVYPFYPDLVIFHVYGANDSYEQIIKNIRSRTTSEVLMQKDHATYWPQDNPDPNADKGIWWDYMMNQKYLPEIAKKYGCGLVDVRTAWVDYLKTNHLEPKALLIDGVHLNAHGNYLMARIIERYLVYRPDLKPDDLGAVKDLPFKAMRHEAEDSYTTTFIGNRIDIVAANDAKLIGPIDVLIDGKRPSAFPDCYAITRADPGPWTKLFIRRVDHINPLILEHWTYTVTKVNTDKTWAFNVSGSVTGPDGSGTSDKLFVSNSGRVKIDPTDYFRGWNDPLPNGYVESWDVVPMFTDTYTPPAIDNPATEYLTTLAQGLSNTEHTVKLTPESGGKLVIKSLRVYRPLVSDQ
jgi:lysophospholipase L1-like esterase